MNIVVCIKRVAATDSTIKLGSDGKSIDPSGVEFVLNPYDEFAVEEAIKTKEATGDGTVTVITLGSADAQKELRTCLAMGADKAVLLNAGDTELDAFNTAAMVGAYVKSIPHDLVFCGKQAVDGDDSQFPSRLATILDLPCVTEVQSLALEGGVYTAARDIEGAREVVSCPTPAVISTNKGLNEPRYANLKGIMAAKKKPLETIDVTTIAPATTVAELTLPPERPEGKILDTVDELIAALKNDAKVL
ncbi:MAG: electron transfer flavoprotein subunit beta/FixA family protein [Planctomycetes bacterium]|nr:electron transfer flavoprotein subunit beta/FixA family protein [Planctomycetota bacterium]